MKAFIPPFLFLFCIILMQFLANFIPQPPFLKIDPLHQPLGASLMLLGLGMIVYTGRYFRKIDTQIHTFKTPRKLVTNRLFRYSRNPIYLGFSIALIGFGILKNNAITLVGPTLFILIANFWYIPFEEQNLEKQFGEEYLSYKARVRRWV